MRVNLTCDPVKPLVLSSILRGPTRHQLHADSRWPREGTAPFPSTRLDHGGLDSLRTFQAAHTGGNAPGPPGSYDPGRLRAIDIRIGVDKITLACVCLACLRFGTPCGGVQIGRSSQSIDAPVSIHSIPLARMHSRLARVCLPARSRSGARTDLKAASADCGGC